MLEYRPFRTRNVLKLLENIDERTLVEEVIDSISMEAPGDIDGRQIAMVLKLYFSAVRSNLHSYACDHGHDGTVVLVLVDARLQIVVARLCYR